MFPILNLDRLDFNRLFETARKKLSLHAPEWTNHNYSDPGITLLELLLFFTDILYYRLDYIGDAHRRAYLRLLKTLVDKDPEGSFALFRKTYFGATSGVTSEDLKTITAILTEAFSGEKVARVHLFQERKRQLIRILPILEKGNIDQSIAQRLIEALEPCRPLTLRFEVGLPQFTDLVVEAWIVPQTGFSKKTLEVSIRKAIEDYLSPARGLKGQGYPPGRVLSYSEIMALLEEVVGVDGVTHLSLRSGPGGKRKGLKMFPAYGAFFRLAELNLTISPSKEDLCW